MKLYTVQLSKWRLVKERGIRLVDTTVRTGYKQLAPTWGMVLTYKEGVLSEEEYTEQYYSLLEGSRLYDPRFWQAFTKLDTVAIACYCRAGVFCHRHLLKDFLVEQYFAEYLGEIKK